VKRLTPILVVLAISSLCASALANVDFSGSDVPTVFFISKSDDRNRVDYGIRLDAACLPTSGSPMVVYWREFEGGRDGLVTHGLNIFEGPVYGVGTQRLTETRTDGVTLRIDIRALSSRRIEIRTALAVEHAGEGDGLAHVRQAAEPRHGALEAEAEARVGEGAVAAQIEVPLERARGQLVVLDRALEQRVEIVFALPPPMTSP
jgi:hypothetical protein